MGEYVKYNGESLKLGTCEDLYYVTFEQVQQLAKVVKFCEGNIEPREYLDPECGWRYRFPFPDEDNTPLGQIDDFRRGWPVPNDGTLTELLHAVNHEKVQAKTVNREHEILIEVHCPYSLEFSEFGCRKDLTDKPAWLISQQKQVDGELWTVCECPGCGAKSRLPKDEARKVVAALIENGKELDYLVAERILKGYENGNS